MRCWNRSRCPFSEILSIEKISLGGKVFNEFNARKPDEMNIFIGVTRNRLFMGIIGITVLLQVLIIEFLGKFTKTVRLNWKLWLVSVTIGLISGYKQ